MQLVAYIIIYPPFIVHHPFLIFLFPLRQHYDDVVNLERIEWLKKEVRSAKSPAQSRINDMSSSLLDTTLLTVENLSKELDSLKRSNRDLRRSSLGGTGGREHVDKDSLFLEGASWMGRKVLDFADRLGDRVSTLAFIIDR